MMPPERRWLLPMTLAYISLAWAVGTYLGSALHTSWFTIFAALIPLASLPFLSRNRKPYAMLLALSLLALTGGSLRFSATQSALDPNSVSRYNEQGIQAIRGEVSAEPEAGSVSVTVRLKVQAVKENEVWTEASGVVLLRQRPYPEYHQGDMLEVTGKLKTPEADGESGYSEYLARQGIVSLMDYPSISLVKHGTAGLAEWLRTLRTRLSESIGSALPEPQASLAQAILLGERKDIPDYLNAAFAHTGTMHLLAISGMNLSIFAGMLLSFAVWLLGKRRFIYVWVAVAGVWAYAALTGMYPPVFRAAAMATIFLLAEYFGRQGSALVAITFAGAVMVAIDPLVLWSVSFQLSFIAMAGLILFTPAIQAWGQARAEPLVQRHLHLQGPADFAISSVAVTLGATLATWPLIAYYFGILSAVSLPANLAIVPALPLIMLSAAATAVVGLAAPAAAWFAGWVAWPALTYLTTAVLLFDKFPHASWNTVSFPVWAVLVYYVVLALTVWLPHMSLFRRLAPHWTANASVRPKGSSPMAPFIRAAKWAIPPLLAIMVFAWGAVLNLPDGKLRVVFLDVGNGDAALVSTPGGRHMLIDGGPDPKKLEQQLGANMPFWDRDIDLVVLTHPHADHLTGLVSILDAYRVKQVLESNEPYDSSIYREWRSKIAEKGLPLIAAAAGQSIDLGQGIRLTILHTVAQPAAGESADPDDSVLVLRLEWEEVSFIFTADAGKEVEWSLLQQRADVKATVLKVAHHGSASSTSAEFLAVAKPGIAVVSVGAINNFNLPQPEVMDRLLRQVGEERLYTTAEHGSVSVTTDGKQVWIDTER